MDLGLTGHTALITGADSGIGWHTARLLLAEGARVALTDVGAGRLQEAAERLGAGEDRLVAVAADLTDPDAVQRLQREVPPRLGDPDVLVHCAGVTGAQGLFHEIDEDGWRSTLDTDFLAAVRVVRAFLDPMRAKGWGRIVLVASEDAQQPYVDELPYSAAKAALLNLTKGLSKTYASEGVLVNAVSPAFIATPMTDAVMEERAQQDGTSVEQAISTFLDEDRPFMELKRRGDPDEVASVIAFLVSERASFVNGSNYRVDSGSVATI
ncbi:SDR family oxidoreductase [Kineococcus sp. TRM81007]|uniref:SDR family NAD(P)-dependent oxidoreductase n=1 Tax=Kineococcus sp. TRM81007 TaxID=2925831 RepID=UPI001F595B22|nr:SDR family oxidoreductase [Kineococcus sp. TRM81007]MCI2237506.1 SDR family oxidoreductase [Kineococcus sp. TRM81007]